jgi:diaminopimelate epimerase
MCAATTPRPLAARQAVVHAGAVPIPFWKYEGLGNDFIVVDHLEAPNLTAETAAAMCDRHFGVGADGVLLTGLRDAKPFMRVINADGSVPEMCGNGLRCVALFLVERGYLPNRSFIVETDAGPHPVHVAEAADAKGARQVSVHMRPASLAAGDVLRSGTGEAIDAPFEGAFDADGSPLRMTCISMGNPHAVFFDAARDRAQMAVLGPRIERDPRFLAGANVGFAAMREAGSLDLTVWERGVGFTLACGTGACAAAVAAVETRRAARGTPLTVHLPGGPLTICVGERGAPIEMTGPARCVFRGELAR